MERKRRRDTTVWSVIAFTAIIAGYFSFIRSQQQVKQTVITRIMAGSEQDDEIWNSVNRIAKDKCNATLKSKWLTDYNQPNEASEDGDTDLNAFQYKSFLQTWNKAYKTDLVSLGDTFIIPTRLCSKQYRSVKEIPDGGTVAVPNGVSNEPRILFILKNAGLTGLKKGTKFTTVNSTSKNPCDLKIKELAADQTVRSLDNVDAAVVNTNYAQAVGPNYKNAIFAEPASKDLEQWVNIIAIKDSEKNNKIYRDAVRAYQAGKTKREVKKLYGAVGIPAWGFNFNK